MVTKIHNPMSAARESGLSSRAFGPLSAVTGWESVRSRRSAAYSSAGAIGVMTTHDLGVAVEEPLKSAARLVHFTEIVDAHGAMTFDYRLRPGLATSTNALRLMQLIGIPAK